MYTPLFTLHPVILSEWLRILHAATNARRRACERGQGQDAAARDLSTWPRNKRAPLHGWRDEFLCKKSVCCGNMHDLGKTSKGQKVLKRFWGAGVPVPQAAGCKDAQIPGAAEDRAEAPLSAWWGAHRVPKAGWHRGIGRSLPALRSRGSEIYNYESSGSERAHAGKRVDSRAFLRRRASASVCQTAALDGEWTARLTGPRRP